MPAEQNLALRRELAVDVLLREQFEEMDTALCLLLKGAIGKVPEWRDELKAKRDPRRGPSQYLTNDRSCLRIRRMGCAH